MKKPTGTKNMKIGIITNPRYFNKLVNFHVFNFCSMECTLTSNLTFLLKVKISKALKRLKKRKKKNRYDKFSKNFYVKAQKSFVKIAKKNKNSHVILDSTLDNSDLEKKIFNLVLKKIKK